MCWDVIRETLLSISNMLYGTYSKYRFRLFVQFIIINPRRTTITDSEVFLRLLVTLKVPHFQFAFAVNLHLREESHMVQLKSYKVDELTPSARRHHSAIVRTVWRDKHVQ